MAERRGKSGCVPCPAAKLGAPRPVVVTESTSELARPGTRRVPGTASKLAWQGDAAPTNMEITNFLQSNSFERNRPRRGRAMILFKAAARATRGQQLCRTQTSPLDDSILAPVPRDDAFSTSVPAAVTCAVWDAEPLFCVAFGFVSLCAGRGRVWHHGTGRGCPVRELALSPDPASLGQDRSPHKRAALVDLCQLLLQCCRAGPTPSHCASECVQWPHESWPGGIPCAASWGHAVPLSRARVPSAS